MFKREDSRSGIYFVTGLGTGLVASGIALELITKAPLTTTCLSSLSIIFVLAAAEFGLKYLVRYKTSR